MYNYLRIISISKGRGGNIAPCDFLYYNKHVIRCIYYIRM